MTDMVIVAVLLNFWSCDIGLGIPFILVFQSTLDIVAVLWS